MSDPINGNPKIPGVPYFRTPQELKKNASPFSGRIAALDRTSSIRFYRWSSNEASAEDDDNYIGTEYGISGRWVKFCEVAKNINLTSETIDFGTIPTVDDSAQTVTVSGAEVGDRVIVNPRNVLAQGILLAYARVSAADTVEINLYNATGGGVAVNQDFDITVVKALD